MSRDASAIILEIYKQNVTKILDRDQEIFHYIGLENHFDKWNLWAGMWMLYMSCEW